MIQRPPRVRARKAASEVYGTRLPRILFPVTPEEKLAYVETVLRVGWEADYHDYCFWRPDGEFGWTAYALCNDLFYWATADAEEIRPMDLPLLCSALAALKAVEREDRSSVATCFLPELYAARKRGMRPQGPYYGEKYLGKSPALVALFDAAGPERTDPDGQRNPGGHNVHSQQ